MPASAPSSRRRLRWIALAAAVVLLALVAAVGIHLYRLLQPQRFTGLLEQNLASAGLHLNAPEPAEPALFPRPGVRLREFSLAAAGSSAQVLRAEGATIVVPWRTLLRGEPAIERIDVDAPRVDLGQLDELFARLPQRAGPPQLPSIMTGIHMSRGTLVRNGSPMLFDFNLDTGALTAGEPFKLTASGRNAAGRRLSAALATVPTTTSDGAIDFNALQLDISGQRGTSLSVGGSSSWRGGNDITMHLAGTLHHRMLAAAPAASGSAAAAASASAAPGPRADAFTSDAITLDLAPAHDGAPLTVAVTLAGADAHADLRLQPTEFGRWWTQLLAAEPGESPVPLPVTGTASAKRIDLGWLQATDITFEAGADLAPGSAPTSAGSAAHPGP